MRVLADTNFFIKFCNSLPLPDKVEKTLDDEMNERCVSAISILETYRLWKTGDLLENPDAWVDLALPSWTVLPVNAPIARQSVLWTWKHKDPADRLITATAMIEGIELWHSDTKLGKFTGFPHRYFKNIA